MFLGNVILESSRFKFVGSEIGFSIKESYEKGCHNNHGEGVKERNTVIANGK
jgi:hypothetical protein